MRERSSVPGVIKPVRWDQEFVIVSNEFARSRVMSPFTKAVLLEIISNAEAWETTIGGIMATQDCGRDKARAVVREGQQDGFVYCHEQRNGLMQIVGCTYHVSGCRRALTAFIEKNGWETPEPENLGPGKLGPSSGRQIKMELKKEKSSKKIKNLKSENSLGFGCKKYTGVPSEGAAPTVEEDFREFAMSVKRMDVNSLMAGGVLYNPKGYAKLGELMDQFGAPVFEQAVREILARELRDAKMRRGGIRCWSYFAGQAADITKKLASGGMPIVEECAF